jgi:hypothetical protein
VTPTSNSNNEFNNSSVNGGMLNDWGDLMAPTLGLAWHHCLSVRLNMSVSSFNSEVVDDGLQHNKVICITKSPLSAQISVPFLIGPSGLV